MAWFGTRTLRIDGREGYRHCGALLADEDVTSNAGNWQWMAGADNNIRLSRVMNRGDRPGGSTRPAAT